MIFSGNSEIICELFIMFRVGITGGQCLIHNISTRSNCEEGNPVYRHLDIGSTNEIDVVYTTDPITVY